MNPRWQALTARFSRYATITVNSVVTFSRFFVRDLFSNGRRDWPMRILIGLLSAWSVWTFLYWRQRANFEALASSLEDVPHLSESLSELRNEMSRFQGQVDVLNAISATHGERLNELEDDKKGRK